MPRPHRPGSARVLAWVVLACACAASAQAQQAPAPRQSPATFEVHISAGLPAAALKSCVLGTLAAPDKGLARLSCVGAASPAYSVIAHAAQADRKDQAMPDGEAVPPEDITDHVQSANPAGAGPPRTETAPSQTLAEPGPPSARGGVFDAVIFSGPRSVRSIRAIEVIF